MRTFYIIALIAWIILGTLWSRSTFCGNEKATKKPAATKSAGAATAAAASGDCNRSLIFSDGDFEASSEENFMFGSSGTKLKTPSAEFQAVLTQVADYLAENEDKTLLLEGLYFEKETNNTSKDNLGLGRSATLKAYLVNQFGVDDSQLLEGSQMTDNIKCYYNKDSKTLSKGAVATFGMK